nr:G protein-coupled receptor [Proales similis]
MRAVFYCTFLSNLLMVSASRQPCSISVYNPAEDCNVDIVCSYMPSDNDFERFRIENASSDQRTEECLQRPNVYVKIDFLAKFKLALSRYVQADDWNSSLPIQRPIKNLVFSLNFFAITGLSSSFSLPPGLHDSLYVIFFFANVQFTDESGSPALCQVNSEANIFSCSVDYFYLEFKYGNVYYENTCDQIFKHARIQFMYVHDLVDSLIRRNVLRFVESETSQLLDSHIEMIILIGYGMQIDKRLLLGSVFSQTTYLRMKGSVNRIDGDFLIGSQFHFIEISVSRLRQFLHNQLSWLEFTNNRLSSRTLSIEFTQPEGKPDKKNKNFSLFFNRLKDIYYSALQLDERYDILSFDADFCIYYRLREKKLNLKLRGLAFEEFASKRCSCVRFWMSNTFMTELNDFTVYPGFEECEKQKENMTRVCDFEKMASRCSIEGADKPFETKEAVYQGIFRLKFVEYLLGLIGSVASFGAVFINCFITFIFRRTRQSDEYRKSKRTNKNRRMWDYVYINTFFVLFQAVVYALGPLTACVQYNGVYCTPLYFTRFMRMFYLFVESYLGNVLKLMGNATNTMFVLYRFAVNRDCWQGLRNTKPIRLVAYFSVLALSISCVRLYVNDRFKIDALNKEIFKYISEKQESSFQVTVSLKVVDLANVLLGNVVFTLVNFIVDLRLLLFLRSHDKVNRKEEAESRITKMIVLSGLCSLLFRLPEIVITILFLVFTFDYSLFPACILIEEPTYSVCSSLFQISRFFFSLTFYENFVLLYIFNPGFKKQLESIMVSSKTR